jgi:hypothetical protein
VSAALRVARRSIGGACLAAVAVASSLDAQAATQTVMEGKRTPRRIVYPFIGAAVGGLASLVYFWSGPRTLPGTCSGSVCVATASLGGGALIGWLVGREKDQLHELRYRGGMPLRPSYLEVDLAGDPMVLSAADSLVVALGGGGAQIVRNGDRPRLLATRAAGLRQMSDAILLPQANELILTANGLYRFPMLSGQGVSLRAAPASAVVALGNDYVVGAGRRVERVPRTASDLGTWPGISLPDSIRALQADPRGMVWALTETEVVGLRPALDSMTIVSRFEVPRGTGQRLDLDGDMLAIALGDSGVRLVSVESPERPDVIADFRDVRFAHDVALRGSTVFVAGGIDGLIKVSMRDRTTLVKEGIARELGFIVSVEAAGDHLWVLDRSSATAILKRVAINF